MGSSSSRNMKQYHDRDSRKKALKEELDAYQAARRRDHGHSLPDPNSYPRPIRPDQIKPRVEAPGRHRDRQPDQENWKVANSLEESGIRKRNEIVPTDLERDFKIPDPKLRLVGGPGLCGASKHKGQEYSPMDKLLRTPPDGEPLFKKKSDKTMAARQLEYHSLSLREQEKQKEWAQHQITISKNCPGNMPWRRYRSESREELKGLICLAGVHLMTDILLAEGKGGMLMRGQEYGISEKNADKWQGPFYFQNWLGWKSPFSIALREHAGQGHLHQREWMQNNKPAPLLAHVRK